MRPAPVRSRSPVPAPAGGPPLVLPAVARLPPVGLSALQWEDDALFFDVVAEIPAEPSSPGPSTRPEGYLLVRSTFWINPPGLIARLLGNDAAIGIGNTSGGVWTDLTHGVPPPPPVDLARAGAAGYRGADGQPHLGALAPIRGTPWAVWAEFPRSVIVAPARLFLRPHERHRRGVCRSGSRRARQLEHADHAAAAAARAGGAGRLPPVTIRNASRRAVAMKSAGSAARSTRWPKT